MGTLLDLHFIRPWWLLALLPALALYWHMWRLTRTHRGWSQIIDPALLPHLLVTGTEEGKNSPVQMVLLGWLLATLAMAGPSWEKTPQPVLRKQDALVILLDLSQSMLAQDLEPSRLHRARRKLRDLMKLRKEGSTALIAYAGDAHIVSPLTDDTRTIANLVPALYPGMMPLPGNDTARAVELALELFRAAGHLEGRILLLTDGIRDDRRDNIQQLLSGSSYSLSIIGVGTADGSPVPDARGKLMKDASGAIVLARLDQSQLEHLANSCGGRYRGISLDDSDLAALTASLDLPLPQREADGLESEGPVRTADSWHDAGYWLVLMCIPLALGAFRRGWVLTIIPLLLLPAEPSSALDWQDLWQRPDQQAAALLDAGNAEAAASKFSDPNWSAAAHYRAENYTDAEQGYASSDTATAWYNRGNALARAGDITAAIAAYDEALQRQPDLEDASFNKALLEQMQDQQQNQQQDQQQDQQDQEQQNEDSSGDEDTDQSGQNQQNQGNQQDQEDQQQQREQNRPGEDSTGDDKPPEQEQEQEQPNSEKESAPEQSPQQQQAQASDESSEQDKATEKWLRQVPDDPAGLLRNKFRYESELRKQQAPRETQDNDW